MEIIKKSEGNKLTIALVGRLDTTTAPELEAEIKSSLDGMTEFVLDFGALEYVSSAGLRVILMAQKLMKKQGSMVLTNVNADIMEVFDITGFSDILTFA